MWGNHSPKNEPAPSATTEVLEIVSIVPEAYEEIARRDKLHEGTNEKHKIIFKDCEEYKSELDEFEKKKTAAEAKKNQLIDSAPSCIGQSKVTLNIQRNSGMVSRSYGQTWQLTRRGRAFS